MTESGRKLVAFNGKRTVVEVGEVRFGRGLVVIAGPCSVESETQMTSVARQVHEAGAHMLRGGVFKPRSSPYAFQGLGVDGLKILSRVGKETGLPVVTEVMDTRDVELVAGHVDMLQVGSRNMQNFSLLKEVGRSGRPVLIKRAMSATLDEWLDAAEYVCREGSRDCVLCERGIRTFESHTRNTLDLSAVPALRELTHLPVIVDPSHGTGVASLVEPMSLAAVAAGADGLMIEVHDDPANAMSDGHQSITPDRFKDLLTRIGRLDAIL
jgi:3-deoxy-7-phosphoheptulonate synthase